MLLRAPGPVERDPLEAVDLPAPVPGPGEVRLTISACGLCHTDLHEVEGELRPPKLPVVPEAFAFRLPGGFTDAQAAPLLCAGIIGYRALRLADVKPGERLGLFGFGASAHIAIQVARFWGCEVWVFTRSAEHRALAKALGASWVGGADDKPPGLLDRAISFAPAGGVIPLALAKLRKGGTLALAGIHLDKIPEMPYTLLYGERTLRSVTASTRRDAEALLTLAARIPIKTEVEVFPLEEANAALQRLKASRISGAGVLRIAP